MIKQLRKRHLQIWMVWAFLIPAGLIAAWVSIPQAAKDKLLQPVSAAGLPVVIKSVDKENYIVKLRSNSDTSQLQLEWINKKILTYPTAAIYLAKNDSKNIDEAELIGRIEARGTYDFVLARDRISAGQFISINMKLVIYDFIHQRIIDSLTL